MNGAKFIEVDPRRTAVVILGASEWPQLPCLHNDMVFSPSSVNAFTNSSLEIFRYFISDTGFGLPRENILNLFDSEQEVADIGQCIEKFINDINKRRESIRDIFIYYIGHGGFTNDGKQFYLAIKNTRQNWEENTALNPRLLANMLKRSCSDTRKYIFLDCCFAASAFSDFQPASPVSAAAYLASDALQAVGTSSLLTLPNKGTVLVCASGSRNLARLRQGFSHTLFTSALIKALRTGRLYNENARISIDDVHSLVLELLEEIGEIHVRPEVHCPDMREGNPAHVQLFPNVPVAFRELGIDLRKRIIVGSVNQNICEQVRNKLGIQELLHYPVSSCNELWEAVARGRGSSIIMDTSLPTVNGIGIQSVLIKMREQGFTLPTVIISSRGTISNNDFKLFNFICSEHTIDTFIDKCEIILNDLCNYKNRENIQGVNNTENNDKIKIAIIMENNEFIEKNELLQLLDVNEGNHCISWHDLSSPMSLVGNNGVGSYDKVAFVYYGTTVFSENGKNKMKANIFDSLLILGKLVGVYGKERVCIIVNKKHYEDLSSKCVEVIKEIDNILLCRINI